MLVCGILAALTVSQLATAPAGAFSVSPSRSTKVTPPSRTSPIAPSPRGPSMASFGSLRDLIDSPAGKDGDDDTGGPAADDFNNRLINFSRSKFADTKFRTRSVYGTGTDDDAERGLHRDRLSPFSFASNAPKSGSGLSLDDEATVVAEDVSSLSVEDADGEEEEDVADEGDVTSPDVDGGDVIAGEERKSRYEDDTMIADNHADMIGLYYSNRRYPVQEKTNLSEADQQDQLGLHGDRLSTFSFSSNKAESRSRTQPVPEDVGVDAAADKVEDESTAAVAPRAREDLDASFGVDNFHNNVVSDMSKLSSSASRQAFSASEGEDNHGDRLSTFSLARKEDKGGTSMGPAAPSASAGSGGSPLLDADNHGDRLGTFSFASVDLQSGSTSAKGTSAVSPLPSTIDSNIKPPQSTTPSKPRADASEDSPNNEASYEVYTPPQKGSLSSLASSVSIKTRNDRINEVKERTDPKRLHPDGMNVPRLNSKGDVMSFSSTGGRPNFFQRIEKVNQELEKGGSEDEGKGDAVEKNTDGMVNGVDYDGIGDILEGSASDDESKGDTTASGDCFIGFDLGTSGARMSIVEKMPSGDYDEVVTSALPWNDNMQFDDAKGWKEAVDKLLWQAQGTEVMSRVKAICVSGTSATCLLVNKHSLDVFRRARMYNFDILSSKSSEDSPVDRAMRLIDEYVPEKHTARATTGSLAKLLLWNEEQPLADEALCHQSDYVSMSLAHEGLEDKDKCTVTSDWHNCLKLGYDVQRREFPSWMHSLLKEGANISDPESVLPSKVISPGEPFGVISPTVASKYGLSSNVVLVGGTTDSNAAFFAAAGAEPDYGTAVTSLGSTLAIKQLSRTFVEDASRGVYSHRFPRFAGKDGGDEEDAWLIGGASNVGCAILRQEGFSNEELAQLSAEIDPNTDSPLSYYPLMKKGERFPVADSEKEPVLEPKPDSRKEYLHGLLQGIGDVEREGFKVLGELGASPNRPTVVWSCGGGSKNDCWISMRERRLKDICDQGQLVQVKRADNTEASFGAALLAAAHVAVTG